jgi:hypothetical protein
MVHYAVTGEHITDRPKTDDTSTFSQPPSRASEPEENE